MDDNAIRRLLDQVPPEEQQNVLAQILGQQQQAQGSPMPQPRYDVAPMQQNTMRFESGPDQGRVVPLDFTGSANAPPTAQASAAPQPRAMRVVGSGNGTTVDLGNEQSPGRVQLDITRAPIDVPGVGKAFYSKDGRGAYVMGPDGQPSTKVILGYDLGGSMALQKRDQERDLNAAQIAHTQEQIAASQQARNTKEGIPGMGIPQSVLEKQFGKAPEGKRWTSQGVLEDVPGGGGGKLTESQGKAAGLASRAQEAHDILTGMESQGVMTPGLTKMTAEGVAGMVPFVGDKAANAAGALTNWTQSQKQQRVEQAQRDFVNAALRVESGASISQSEFDNARKQYFPQPGDSPEVIKQKQEGREREIRSLAIQAGPGANAAGVSTKPISDPAMKSRAIFEAKKAIQAGAPAQAVKARLAAMGITEGL